MNLTIKKMIVMSGIALMACGCSMGDDSETDNGTANQSTEQTPTKTTTSASEDSIDYMMTYLKEKGIEISDMKNIENMDFAAHEGRSFMYNGSMAYLYRLNSSDTNMKALLDQAAKEGKVKVSMDGSEMEYTANVNGDYLLVYQDATNMGDMMNAFPGYVPGATTTTPNNGGNGEGMSDQGNGTMDNGTMDDTTTENED